ncbi:MarR family winged helix-turn-helix transcriptional regulator [Mycolicibacterium fluoranthenivorans]|uniref:DNA-binding transcriptional regulator, MarR family n=1 Tax=Mycolicibacterium fluoranthenivorans TaxID=258505 RepID=A0A1G4VN95_9MYCO|nr:MarR family transcriptional regulator [Mycolicibacterium fluoranthenivorans]SCX08600.1 DNA-binding transcriptional regulator, MarR family [Mycolicibacterium fluoranthenivorans]
MSDELIADEVWQRMSALVHENRGDWKRAVIDRSGLPFSRIRVLRRLARTPMTVKELAEAATMDAPAATVAVNDLEERGLVLRQTNPANRRCKVVSLTEEGQAVAAAVEAVQDPAPAALAALGDADLLALQTILRKLTL